MFVGGQVIVAIFILHVFMQNDKKNNVEAIFYFFDHHKMAYPFRSPPQGESSGKQYQYSKI